MKDVITSSIFINFVLPLATVFLGLVVKLTSKNDRCCRTKREDFAIGFDIALIAVFSVFTQLLTASKEIKGIIARLSKTNLEGATRQVISKTLTDIESKTVLAPTLLVVFIFSLMAMAYFVRTTGWEHDKENSPSLWCGTIIPIAYGLLLMYLASFVVG